MAKMDVTALLVGPKARPSVEDLVGLLTELWEEEIVARKAVVSVGPVTAENVVAGADKVGDGRKVAWQGTDLKGLIAAVRAQYGQDVAVWFPAVDLEAFEPAEEEEYEDVEDEGDEGDEDDEPAAGGKAAAPPADDHDFSEFELVSPSLCLYSVRNPIVLEEKSDYVKTPADAKKLKKFGPVAAWATLDGEDMRLLVDDLGDCWLRDVVEDAFGAVKVGKNLW